MTKELIEEMSPPPPEYKEEVPSEVIEQAKREEEARIKAKAAPKVAVRYPAEPPKGLTEKQVQELISKGLWQPEIEKPFLMGKQYTWKEFSKIVTPPRITADEFEGQTVVLIDGKPAPTVEIEGVRSVVIPGRPELGIKDKPVPFARFEGLRDFRSPHTLQAEMGITRTEEQIRSQFKEQGIEVTPEEALFLRRVDAENKRAEAYFEEIQKLDPGLRGAKYAGIDRGQISYIPALEIARVQAQTWALQSLSKYKVNGGYNLALAMVEGVSASAIKAAGFSAGDVTEAKRGMKTIQARTQALRQMERFRTEGGDYNIALASAYGVPDVVIKRAGFTDQQLADVEDMIAYYKASPKGKFDILQQQGLVPDDATFKEIDKDGNVVYTLPGVPVEGTAKDWLLAEKPDTQASIIRLALGQSLMWKAKPFEELTDTQKEKVLKYYTKRAGLQPAAKIIVAVVPILGTVYYWDGMTPGERALSIGLDALFFATPFILPKAVGLVRGLGRVPGTARVVDIINTGGRQMVRTLRKVAPALVKPYRAVVTAQQRYANQLLYVRQLENLLKRGVGELTPEVQRSLSLARQKLATLEAAFTQASRDYVKAANPFVKKEAGGMLIGETPLVRGKRITAISDAAVQELKELPSSLLRATTQLVDDISSPRTITAIAEDLRVAQVALRAAQTKWATQPAKWSDLSTAVTRLEGELMLRQVGGITNLHQQLIDIRKTIPLLEKMVKEARATNSPYLADLEIALEHATLQNLTLPRQIDNLIKSMEVEWGRGGWLGGGRMPVLAPAKPGVIVPRGGGVKTPSPKALYLPLPAVKGVILPFEVQKEEEKPEKPTPKVWTPPEFVPLPWEFAPAIQRIAKVQPVEVPGISTKQIEDLKFAFRSLMETGISLSEAIEILTASKVVAAEMTATQIQTVVQPLAETARAQQVATRVTEVTKLKKPTIKIPVKIPPPVIIRAKEEEEEKRLKKLALYPICWRQGFIWVVVKPPYKQSDLYIRKRPPKGAEVVEGVRSAYKTIQSIGGDAHELELAIDAGIIDILIKSPTKKAGRKGAIRFRKDPKQKTKGDISLAGAKLPKMFRRKR